MWKKNFLLHRTGFSSIDHLCLCAQLLILFYPAYMRFSQFNIHHKNWLTFTGGTDTLVNSIIVFLSETILLRLTFLLKSQSATLTVLLFWVDLLFQDIAIVLLWQFLHWGILMMLLSLFSLTFLQTQEGMPLFIAQCMTILMLPGIVFSIIWEMFQRRISLNLVILLVTNEFCERV